MGVDPKPISTQASDEPSPRRGTVFGEILWRSIALAIAGGAIVGLVGFPASIYLDGDVPDNALHVMYLGWIGFVFGAAFGMLLGLPLS